MTTLITSALVLFWLKEKAMFHVTMLLVFLAMAACWMKEEVTHNGEKLYHHKR